MHIQSLHVKPQACPQKSDSCLYRKRYSEYLDKRSWAAQMSVKKRWSYKSSYCAHSHFSENTCMPKHIPIMWQFARSSCWWEKVESLEKLILFYEENSCQFQSHESIRKKKKDDIIILKVALIETIRELIFKRIKFSQEFCKQNIWWIFLGLRFKNFWKHKPTAGKKRFCFLSKLNISS